jgi:leucyl-tRNA synthetase
MSHQNILKETGKRHKVSEVKGDELIGTKLIAPFSLMSEVYVLPMETVLATKVSHPLSTERTAGQTIFF